MRWVLSWRTPAMPASAFWEFATKLEALVAARDLQPTAVYKIRRSP